MHTFLKLYLTSQFLPIVCTYFKKWTAICYSNSHLFSSHRKLFPISLRDPIRKIDGLLPNPDLYPVRADRHHLLGQFLVEQKRHSGQSGAGRHHCIDHDYAYVIHERRVTQNILRQVDRRLLGYMFRHGVR